MRHFNPEATRPVRAVQAWQILVGKAMNRQTVTYDDLGKLMFRKKAPGVLAHILGHVAFYCIENDLPPLTCNVVGKHGGTPRSGIPIDPTTVNEQREKVYGWDWYNVYPPSEAELAEAYLAHRNSN
jgi:hypothetical protein